MGGRRSCGQATGRWWPRSSRRGSTPSRAVRRWRSRATGGATFSAPRVLRQFDATQEYTHSGNVALGPAGDGALVLLAMAMKGDERNTIFGWRSADSGLTWEPVNTAKLGDSATGSVYGSVFAVPGRGLAVCGHYRRPRGQGVWIAFSEDDGRGWGEAVTIAADRRLVEPAFVCVGERLIGLVRENATHAYREFVSEDAGTTWRESRLVMRGPEAVHPSPFVAADPTCPSRLYALQSQRTERGEVYLWSADAGALDWRRRGLVAAFEGIEDYSYPWMTHLRGEEWFVVFYAGKRRGSNSIHGMTMVPD
ncbi:MAG: exo-alpha-sialidase [Armatimonadota bacterium]